MYSNAFRKQMPMKDSELTGICKKALEKDLCNGCGLLEDINFRGLEKCDYVPTVQDKIDFCKRILKGEK